MRFFDVAALPVSPWRNGGGDTREIAYVPSEAHGHAFAWRTSVATIAADGPFSAFPGVDRTITLLAGDGVTLSADGMPAHELVRVGEPFSFSGDLAIRAALAGGPCRVLNIMAMRGAWAADVRRTSAGTTPRAGGSGVLHVLEGSWQCGTTTLTAGQGAWWDRESADTLTPLTPDSVALEADIRRSA
ncbi:HutD family protein [Streptomycetaceae bacterium NBC_01309]